MKGCPACGSRAELRLVEKHRDRIGGQTYSVGLCRACGVVSSEPRTAIGGDWYEKAAPLRALQRPSSTAQDDRFLQFFRDVRPPAKVLDIGCGNGGFMRQARKRGFRAVGFDYDERVVALARAQKLEAYAAEFEAWAKARPSAEFDAVTLFDVLEHQPEPARFLTMARRLLKPGGFLAVTLPNALRPLPWGREEHDYPPHHFTRWTPDALKGFLERHGLEVVRQDCGVLRLRYLSDHFFFYRVLPPALAAAKRFLFGKKASSGESIAELYERERGPLEEPGKASRRRPSGLADPAVRRRLVGAAAAAAFVGFLPAALILRAYYRRREPRGGDGLYTLARLPRARKR